MRSKDRTMPPRSGTVAPVVPVPRPRAVTGISSSLHSASVASTCAGSVMKSTACGSAWRLLLS